MSLRGEGEDVVQIRAQVIAAQMTSVTVDVIVGIQIVAAGVDVGEGVAPRSSSKPLPIPGTRSTRATWNG